MQQRHFNSRPQAPPPMSAQADVLAYPSSSLVHFQQLLQAQAANGFVPPQLDAQHHPSMSQTIALQAAQHAAQQAQQAASQQHQWLPPKAAATLAPPSDKSNRDQAGRDPSRSAALSPSGYALSFMSAYVMLCSCSACMFSMPFIPFLFESKSHCPCLPFATAFVLLAAEHCSCQLYVHDSDAE